MYIVFEGVVGTGKTTQSKRLAKYLEEKYPNKSIMRVREPGTGEIAEAIRTLVQANEFSEPMDPLCEAHLYAASRAQLIMTRLIPFLDKWGIVVSDRSVWTALSFQGYAKWVGMDAIWALNREAVEKRLPDMILYMDLPVEEGRARSFDADGDKHEREGIEFFERAAEGYRIIGERDWFKGKRHAIDASGSQDEVFERILKTIEQHGNMPWVLV